MLKVNGIDVFYGRVQALFDLSFEVSGNGIVSVIGSNGAGKSTLMKTIMGLNKPTKGTIEFNGEIISGLKTDEIVKKGIVYVPEGREIFSGMTVRDNLKMGAFTKSYSKDELEAALEESYEMFPRLKERQNQKAGSLSGGEQQMLAIARGLMSKPKLIMFDEPSLGLAPVIVDEMFDIIVRINKEQHIPIVIVEQNAFMAMEISDETYVIDLGEIKAHGPSKEMIESEEIKKAYLGD